MIKKDVESGQKIGREVLFSYAGLPSEWSKASESCLEVSELRLRTIKQKLKVLPDYPVCLYVEGEVGVLVNLWLEDAKISDFLGVNFIDYMSNVFEQDSLVPKKYTILYNVGLERALKSDFSSRVLKGLIQDTVNQGCHVIIQGVLNITDFKRNYGITDVNSVRLMKKPQEKLI